MSEEAKSIYEVLIKLGATPTGVLRREAGPGGQHNASRFDRALRELQMGLKIAKCGISDANRWKYSYVYDILLRWLPEQVKLGLSISSKEAMQAIITQYLKIVVASTPERVAGLFDWSLDMMHRITVLMLAEGSLLETEIMGQEGRWITVV